MQPLSKPLRRQLETAVVAARDTAETGARAALDYLGVGEAEAPRGASEEQRALRRRLRAHGRQLGDRRHPDGRQDCIALIEETAYEHWHRMLFARFLAENNLLMHPDGVALSLAECQELAPDEGAANGWELAGRYAARMLPQIFRPDSPALALSLAPEHQRALERLLADLEPEHFQASDSLGWVYQFWQSKRKQEVNNAEVKIGARELPAVTQLFTEPYMVSFLLDNALGAWWAARRLTGTDLQNASSEAELRRKAAIPGVPLDSLRFVQQEDGTWTPAAGTFEAWPDHLGELKTLDPCCGSGHFLVAALLMLVPMRMALEDLSAHAAVDAVLRQNLHGLELDQRCVELAAFALALSAWTYPDAGGYRPLPALNLACSGLSVSAAKEEWKQLGLGKQNLAIALDWLHDSFQDAPVLGSLLEPGSSDAAKLVRWEALSEALASALDKEPGDPTAGSDGDALAGQEAAVVAQGLARAASLLDGRYQWVITNVPYLARGKQRERLRTFCERHYPAAKNDLATVFLQRCLGLCVEGGATSLVLPQNWLFLTSYRKFRERLLTRDRWHLIARLGPGAFETISGEVVKAILLCLSRGNPQPPSQPQAAQSASLLPPPDAAEPRADAGMIRGLDVSACRTAADKAAQLLSTEIKSVEQAAQLRNPDARVGLEMGGEIALLNDCCYHNLGLCTGDSIRFYRKVWEFNARVEGWEWMQGTVDEFLHYGGCDSLVFWQDGSSQLFDFVVEKLGEDQVGSWLRGKNAWGRHGILISAMRELPATSYLGSFFDENAVVIVVKEKRLLDSVFSCVSDESFNINVRKINQTLKVRGDLVKIPFDLDHWTQVAAERYPNGLPKPYTDDPTQWIFHGHPCGSVIWDEDAKWTAKGPLRTDDSVLQVAVARLLGYRWPAELDPDMELAGEQRAWVQRCEALLPHADDDGILCIPPVRGEAAAADRLLNLLAEAYGEAWSTDTLAALLRSADHAGRPLETWLRDKFFAQHCKRFQQRPFIWHLWDGQRDGFAALVNYHQLDRQNLERLIYTYLGDWIRTQERTVAEGRAGADDRLAAAEGLKAKLEAILEGEAPLDIFVRWKPLEQQPIGWAPDLNDGVRLNIRPFLLAGDVGRRGAGVLRDKPNIHWKKDRGKDVASAPWFHLGPTYGGKEGDRINDHHLTLAEKRAAQAAASNEERVTRPVGSEPVHTDGQELGG